MILEPKHKNTEDPVKIRQKKNYVKRYIYKTKNFQN